MSQIRIDELSENFAGSVELEYRYLHVFGDVPRKMEASWKDCGGPKGYDEHVSSVYARFEHVAPAPHVWLRAAPRSSMPSHLMLCTVRLPEAEGRVRTGTLPRTHGIQASPTLLLNEGRQRLGGNVGYRIIEANVRELLEGAPGQASWC